LIVMMLTTWPDLSPPAKGGDGMEGPANEHVPTSGLLCGSSHLHLSASDLPLTLLILLSTLGNDPWDVFHQGLSVATGLSIGTCTMAAGAVVLLLWLWVSCLVILVGAELNHQLELRGSDGAL
jgi:hypothetical protein